MNVEGLILVLEKQIGELTEDFESGASEIAQKGLRIFVDGLSSGDFIEGGRVKVYELKEAIINAKPAMSALKNIINQAYGLYQQGLVAESIRKCLLGKMREETKKCIELAQEKIFEMNFTGIATCSFSSTVLKLFESLRDLGYFFKVYAMESLWRGRDYSERVIEECKRMGIEAKKLKSEDLKDKYSFVGIIGADSLIPGRGVVNGVPSFRFAKLLNRSGVGLYVIAESFKRSDEVFISDGFDFIGGDMISGIFGG